MVSSKVEPGPFFQAFARPSTAGHGAAIYGFPWIPSIYPIDVSIYIITMDPMGKYRFVRTLEGLGRHFLWPRN